MIRLNCAPTCRRTHPDTHTHTQSQRSFSSTGFGICLITFAFWDNETYKYRSGHMCIWVFGVMAILYYNSSLGPSIQYNLFDESFQAVAQCGITPNPNWTIACVPMADATLSLKYTFWRTCWLFLLSFVVSQQSVSPRPALLIVAPWQAVCHRSQEAVQGPTLNELIIWLFNHSDEEHL